MGLVARSILLRSVRIRVEGGQMYKHILIATDGSDLAGKALEQGLSLAKALAAQVTIVTVTEPWATRVMGEAAIAFPFNEYEKAMAANAAEILSKASAMATQAGVACSVVHVTERHPEDGILETANGIARLARDGLQHLVQ